MAKTGNGTDATIESTSAFSSAANYSMHLWYRNANAASGSTDSVPMSLLNGGAHNAEFSFIFNHSSAGLRQAFNYRESGGTFRTAQLTTTMLANTWYSVGGSYDGTNVKAYLNGALEATTASAAGASVADMKFAVFAQADVLTAKDSGTVAEAAIWTTALSLSEWAALAAGVPPLLIRPASLFWYAPLLVNIVSAFGPPVTISGTIATAAHPRVFGMGGSQDIETRGTDTAIITASGALALETMTTAGTGVVTPPSGTFQAYGDLALQAMRIDSVGAVSVPTPGVVTPQTPKLIPWEPGLTQKSSEHQRMVSKILNSLIRSGRLYQTEQGEYEIDVT